MAIYRIPCLFLAIRINGLRGECKPPLTRIVDDHNLVLRARRGPLKGGSQTGNNENARVGFGGPGVRARADPQESDRGALFARGRNGGRPYTRTTAKPRLA
jgi:hypothetical protein